MAVSAAPLAWPSAVMPSALRLAASSWPSAVSTVCCLLPSADTMATCLLASAETTATCLAASACTMATSLAWAAAMTAASRAISAPRTVFTCTTSISLAAVSRCCTFTCCEACSLATPTFLSFSAVRRPTCSAASWRDISISRLAAISAISAWRLLSATTRRDSRSMPEVRLAMMLWMTSLSLASRMSISSMFLIASTPQPPSCGCTSLVKASPKRLRSSMIWSISCAASTVRTEPWTMAVSCCLSSSNEATRWAAVLESLMRKKAITCTRKGTRSLS